jgi:hypothetical protein
MTWYQVFGHLEATDEAPELFADHQDEAELAYDQYAGVMVGAAVLVKAHHLDASGNGHAGILSPAGSAIGVHPSYNLSE